MLELLAIGDWKKEKEYPQSLRSLAGPQEYASQTWQRLGPEVQSKPGECVTVWHEDRGMCVEISLDTAKAVRESGHPGPA